MCPLAACVSDMGTFATPLAIGVAGRGADVAVVTRGLALDITRQLRVRERRRRRRLVEQNRTGRLRVGGECRPWVPRFSLPGRGGMRRSMRIGRPAHSRRVRRWIGRLRMKTSEVARGHSLWMATVNQTTRNANCLRSPVFRTDSVSVVWGCCPSRVSSCCLCWQPTSSSVGCAHCARLCPPPAATCQSPFQLPIEASCVTARTQHQSVTSNPNSAPRDCGVVCRFALSLECKCAFSRSWVFYSERLQNSSVDLQSFIVARREYVGRPTDWTSCLPTQVRSSHALQPLKDLFAW